MYKRLTSVKVQNLGYFLLPHNGWHDASPCGLFYVQNHHHYRTEPGRSDQHLSRGQNQSPSLHPCTSAQEQQGDEPSAHWQYIRDPAMP